MGFTWAPIEGQVHKDSDDAELRTNIDTVISDLDATAFNWTDVSAQGEIIRASEILQIREAADYADDQNYCRAEKIALDITNYPSYHPGYQATYYYSRDHPYYLGRDISQYASVLSTHHATDYSGYNSGYDGTLYFSPGGY